MPWDYALVTLFHNVADISGPFKIGGCGGPKEPEAVHPIYCLVHGGQGMKQ